MKATLAIARHEIATIFHSIYGWVSLSIMTVFLGYFLYAVGLSFLEAYIENPESSYSFTLHAGRVLMGSADRLLLFLTPLLTAASISAERKNKP